MKQFIVLLGLMLLPAQAFAECAWVLWTGSANHPGGMGQVNTASTAFTSRDECLRALEKERDSGADAFRLLKGYNVVKLENTIVITDNSTNPPTFLSSSWRCLPDTVDPRERRDR